MTVMQRNQYDTCDRPSFYASVMIVTRWASLIMISISQAWAAADFAVPSGGSAPIESYSGNFSTTISGGELLYLQNGIRAQANYGSDVYLLPLFSYQICFSQDQADGAIPVSIVNASWPSLLSSQNNISYTVPIALKISGNGLGTSTDTSADILFLKDSTDAAKTVRILDENVFSGDQLNTSAIFAVTTYSGNKKKAFNDTSSDSDDKLKHFTHGGVTHSTGSSSPTTSSSTQFVRDQTTLTACSAVTGGASAAITITGYAYLLDLIENPAGTYTLSADLQYKIEAIN